MTAQQLDNALTSWMADTAGSPARFQILVLLWASEADGVPHKEIVKAPGSDPRDRVGTDGDVSSVTVC